MVGAIEQLLHSTFGLSPSTWIGDRKFGRKIGCGGGGGVGASESIGQINCYIVSEAGLLILPNGVPDFIVALAYSLGEPMD